MAIIPVRLTRALVVAGAMLGALAGGAVEAQAAPVMPAPVAAQTVLHATAATRGAEHAPLVTKARVVCGYRGCFRVRGPYYGPRPFYGRYGYYHPRPFYGRPYFHHYRHYYY